MHATTPDAPPLTPVPTPAPAPGVLALDGVSYAVQGGAAGPRTLLDGLTFAVQPGARTIVLGPNGAGKSLTLRILHGLLQPTAGRVRLGADDVTAGSRHGFARSSTRGAIRGAMVFQRPMMLRRSALANVAYALALRGVPRRERNAPALAALARVGLVALADRPARRLSIGEQQRVALARAWAIVGYDAVNQAAGPGLLLMDEPTASLDPTATKAIETILDEMHAAGATLVMTTHDLAQARRLADAIVFLHRGRVLEHGPAARFFAHPATPEAQAFCRGELLW